MTEALMPFSAATRTQKLRLAQSLLKSIHAEPAPVLPAEHVLCLVRLEQPKLHQVPTDLGLVASLRVNLESPFQARRHLARSGR
jgi:hypothetical protein